MKIRTQFIFTLSLFGLILIGMAASLILTNHQVDELRQQEEIAHRIEQGADELSHLSGDYLMYGEPQQRVRWESSFASLSEDISRLKLPNPEQQTIVNRIKEDQKRLQATFKDVVSTLEEPAQISGAASPPAFQQVSWSRMEVQNLGMAFDASLLSQQLREQADRLRQLNFVLIFILIGIFGAYLLINYYLIDQRTLKSITELQAGTAVIGSGDLGFSIAVKRADEIGELSHAFNRMTANLKEVTASKADLEREIAERKQAEDALRRSESLLQAVLGHVPEAIYLKDLDSRLLLANPATLAVIGKPAEAVLGKTDAEFYDDPATGLAIMENDQRIMTSGLMETVEESVLEPGGTRVYLSTKTPYRDREGRVIGLIGVAHEITESKKAEAALRNMNDRLQAQALELEMQAEQLREQRNELVDANEHLLLSEELAKQRLMEAQAANKELQSARRSALNLMEDALAAQEKVNQINARLRESEQRLERAQEIAHLGSWELDLGNDRLTWSDEVYRIFGLRPQEFSATYEAFLDAVHPDDRPAVDAAYSGSIREGKDNYELEHRIVKRSSGEVRIVHEKCEHFRDENGKIIRSAGMVHDITERKLAEEELRLTLESIGDGFFACDGDWRFVYVNAAAERILGICREEVLGQNHWDVFPLTVGTNLEREYQLAAAGEVRDFENYYEPWDRWFHNRCFPRDGGMSVYFEDITERKRAEEELRAREELYRAVVDHALDAILVTDPCRGGIVLSANPAACQMFGYSVDEFIGLDREAILDTNDPNFAQLWKEREERGQAAAELTYKRRDGTQFSGELSSVFYQDENRQRRAVAIIRDITERKHAEMAVLAARDQLELRVQERTMELAIANRELVKEIAERKEIERQLRLQTTAMEAAANGIIITDDHGNIQWANPAILQVSGYDAHELIGKSTRIFSSGQHDEGYYHQMWETILSGQVWRGETINRRKDGTVYTEEQTITPVRADHDQVTHFIAIKQDITERKQAEENLAQRNVELQLISSAERNQRQFSEALIEAAIILNRSLKLSEVLSLILEQIRGVIPYQFADIVFLEGDSFYVASQQGDFKWSADPADNRFLVEGFPILDRMRKSGKPVLLLDLQGEPDWITLKGFEWARSFLSAPLLVENKVIGFVNLFGDQPRFFTQEMSDRLVAFAAHAGVAIQNAWLFEQVRASTERLQSLSRRLVEIQENERLYISRELHDEAGQVLTSLLVDLRLLEKNAGQPEAILKIVTEMERSLNGVIENLHRMAMALRPASLDHVGLVAALRQHVEAMGAKHGIQASFRSGALVERLPSNVETVLYRTVQEALTNVIRHAHATRVDVVLTVRDNKLIVLVEDDGVGFDPNNVSTDDHLGLFGIRERTEMIGGTLVIESAPGKGTTIMLEVDYANTSIGRR